MKFNQKLTELRKTKGLSQDELGQRIGVSRQTISKWELGQSYPDFQRLVALSDYFGITLDALVKDIDVQDIRDKSQSEKQISQLYDEFQQAKKIVGIVINIFAVIGVVGIAALLGIILIFGQ